MPFVFLVNLCNFGNFHVVGSLPSVNDCSEEEVSGSMCCVLDN